MISDVLSDAADEIRRYLTDPVFADAYDDGTRIHIDALLRHMDDVRSSLEQLPAGPVHLLVARGSERFSPCGIRGPNRAVRWTWKKSDITCKDCLLALEGR